MSKKAIIIGAGPAGLTAAYELLKRTNVIPVILEKSGDIGGISKTINYKGNRIDIGGHRFFSKSDRVMNWWLDIMPVQPAKEKYFTVTYQKKTKTIQREETYPTKDQAGQTDLVMLVRKRLSRIYFLRKFFNYPIQLSIDTLKKLGAGRTVAIIASYLKAQLFPRKPEKSLEDFLINRFGVKLYQLFFKDYTEKVWGVPCQQISAEWGAQRIKGVSISKAIQHAITSALKKKKSSGDIAQKDTETSLIEQFLYPKFGPGQLWEEVARQVQEMGGEIHMFQDVKEIITDDNRITAIKVVNNSTGETVRFEGDYFFSTMPVQELIAGMGDVVAEPVKEVAAGLQYRDFITIGVLLKKLWVPDSSKNAAKNTSLPDTWIYIQERDVKVGRLQIFNNWSPYMVKDPNTVWIGMEYFCNKGDEFWSLSDEVIQQTGITELEQMGLATVEDVLDSTVLRMEKTYPAYFGTYSRFEEIKQFTDRFENLFLVGRNGMHKYNNSDHSMLTAMVSVDNISKGITSKVNIWAINTEQEYHEERKEVTVVPSDSSLIGATDNTFFSFVFNNKINRIYLWASLVAIAIQFIVFKGIYNYANFIPDTYTYLNAAISNVDVNSEPVAYSKFLRAFSAFTTSDTALVFFQYTLISLGLLYLFFTVSWFFKPGKIGKNLLFIFLFFNPVLLYISNCVSSDALFTALSLFWGTHLLWLINRPSRIQIITHAILLLATFTVRYNAIYYPFVTALAFILSSQKFEYKIMGISLSICLVICSILYTSSQMYKVTGYRQFAAFGGWQLANNALYMYEHIPSNGTDNQAVPAKFIDLDRMVRQHMDTISRVQRPRESIFPGVFYLWSSKSPLFVYMKEKWRNAPSVSEFTEWSSVAPLYSSYGAYLIRNYPFSFGKYYLVENAKRYLFPSKEFLAIYNYDKSRIGQPAINWFKLKLPITKPGLSKSTTRILDFYPGLFGVLNFIFMISGFIFFFTKPLARNNSYYFNSMLLIVVLLFGNACFSIFSAPPVLRYEIFPMLFLFTFSFLLIERSYVVIYRKSSNK